MKRVFCLVLAVFSAFFVSAQNISIRLGVLKGISCVPCAYLIENKEKLAVQNMNFQVFDSAQSELPKLLRGEIDAGFLSPKDAAKVFSKGNGSIVVLGITQNCNLYLLSSDENYGALEDLKGKKIACASQGSDSEIMFRSILSKKGLETGIGEGKVLLDYSTPTAEIASALISGKETYALLPEPFATVAELNSTAIKRVEVIQSLFSETEEKQNASFPTLFLVANANFAKQNRQLVKKLIDLYKDASRWTTKNPAKTGLLVEKNGLGLSQNITASSIKNAGLTWRDAYPAQADIERLFSILMEISPDSIGGKLPDDSFYFKK